MSPSASNPYPRDSPEFDAWDRWHRAYFDQPVSGQFFDIAAQLRANVTALLETSSNLLPVEGRRKLRLHIFALDAIANLVEESADHADRWMRRPEQ
jgi:hypothetical protein